MEGQMRIIIVILCLFFSVLGVQAEDINDLFQPVKKHFLSFPHESYRTIIHQDPYGAQREYTLYSLRSEEKSISVFLAPESEKGRAVLNDGKNLWLYVPGVTPAFGIAKHPSLIGTVLNNADLFSIGLSSNYLLYRVEEVDHHYYFNFKKKNGYSIYNEIVVIADKSTQMPKQQICRYPGGKIVKTMVYQKVKSFGRHILIPSVVETQSPLFAHCKTIEIYDKVNKVKIQDFDERFTIDYLPRISLFSD